MRDRTRILAVTENRPTGFAAELPKSGQNRWVPMSWRLRCHAREFFALGSNTEPLVAKWPHHEDYFQRKVFADLSKEAGLGRRLPKDLRDAFASHLLTAGWDTTQIMRWMGHAPGIVGDVSESVREVDFWTRGAGLAASDSPSRLASPD